MTPTLKTPVNDLARACARSADAAEWGDFLRQCAPFATLVAARVCRMWLGTATPSAVDDIVQETFLKLCERERRILRDFRPKGDDSFFGLLRVVTASVGNDYFRRQHSEKRGGKVVTISTDDENAPGIPSTSSDDGEIQKSVLFAQLDDKLQAARGGSTERDRTIFWLYYLQGLTADEIAALPGTELSAKGVESALRRIVTWLRNELEPPKAGRSQTAQESG